MVSHRASSAKLADTILVLEEGRIAALGTHSDLFKEHSYYQAFCKGQLHQ